MDSIVTQVFAETAKIGAADLKDNISIIQKEIAKLKDNVKSYIDDNYIDFLPTLKKDHLLVEEAKKLNDEMQALKIEINDKTRVELSGSTRELKNLSKALQASNISLKLSERLLELHNSLNLVETQQQAKEYINAAVTLKRVETLLNDPHDDLKLLNIYAPLRDRYHTCFASLLATVSNLWEQYVRWSEVAELNQHKTVNLTIDCEQNEVQQLIQSLHHLGDLSTCLHHFSNKLMKQIIHPLVHSDCSVFVNDERVFNVTTTTKKQKASYEIVLHNVGMLFKFLHQHLDVPVHDKTFISRLSEHLWPTLSDDLIQNCISDKIPTSNLELQKFTQVADEIRQLETQLREIGFISENQFLLSDYVKDIDQLYVNKICQDLLVKSSALMKKDLHDSFKYIPEEVENLDDHSLDVGIKCKLNKNSFRLAPCQVSKSTKEILDLVRSILDELIISPEICAAKLYYTSRNVLEQYVWIVPEYHKNFLETIPQQVALFHNNCMYLAHHLMTLAQEYRGKMPLHLEKHNITYVDLTLKLREIGVQCFLDHVKRQRNIILDILRNSGLSELGQELPATTEKSLRQCIRQLELLKTVWFDVLPVNVYSKALGCILNSMIQDLVLKVMTVEDISAAVAVDLVGLFNMLVQRAPQVLPEPESVSDYVSKWQKLLQLIKILEASLREIEEGWAGGKGPLAREFTASQMKQLIRALFQNTERRSALLAVIK